MIQPIVCPVGHFCTGGFHLEECGRGKYSAEGSTYCQYCIPGQLCEETVQEQPNWCPIGYHCANPSQRVACPPGSFSNKYNLTNCENAIWSTWTDISTCSKSCGIGEKAQSRDCTSGNQIIDISFCEGNHTKIVNCNAQSCRKIK